MGEGLGKRLVYCHSWGEDHVGKAWNKSETARGGPFVLRDLPAGAIAELKALSSICSLKSWSQMREQAASIIAGFRRDGWSRRHIEDRCFRCGGPDWTTCSCRPQMLAKSTLLAEAPESERQSGASRSASSSSFQFL